jgi:Histidine kinase-like ATPase domain
MSPLDTPVRSGVASAAPSDRNSDLCDSPASERITRVLYFAAGAAGIIFGALSFQSFQAQVNSQLPALSFIVWILVVGLTAILCVFSQIFSLRTLRVIAAAEATVVMLNLVLWLLFRSEPLPAGFDVPWIITLTGVPAVCVAIMASDRVTWAYSFSVSILGGMLRAATTNYDNPLLVGAEDALYSLLLQALFIRLTLAARRGAAALDDAARTAREDGVKEAAHLGAKQARLTLDALVHDSVISTLLIAGRGRAGADVVSRHADRTLFQLDEFPESMRIGGGITLSHLESRLKTLAERVVPGIHVTCDVTPARALPPEVSLALEGAAGEALRNSVAHARGREDRAVSRFLEVSEVDGRVQVVVSDDGVGFDPSGIPDDRLGISHSILGRMHSVRNGAATVMSRPGAGVKVVLSWTR